MRTRSKVLKRVKWGGSWLVQLGLVLALVPAARAEDGAPGTWEGNYFCGQGDTELTLTLRPSGSEGELDGVFRFHGSARNPRVPDGCFTMTGTYDGQTRAVRLSAGRWLLQPFGYVSVDLMGQLAPGGDRLSGQVVGPLCQGFDLHRVDNGQAATPSACLGSATIAAAR